MEEYKFQLNIKNILPSIIWKYSDQEIVDQGVRRYTYKQFFDRVSRIASGLTKIGVKPGDKVAVLDWDTVHYMESYFSVPMLGAVLHMVNIRYPPELIYYTMQHAEDRFVIIRDEFLPIIERSANLFNFVKGWVIYSDTNPDVKTILNPSYKYEDLLESSEPYDFPDLDENTTATLFYTSGTTGFPKGVSFTHRQIMLHSFANDMVGSGDPLNITNHDVCMSLVPMFHVHSWGYPYHTLLTGNKYVLPGRYEPKKLLELIKNEHVTYSPMVPSILYMILTHPEVQNYAPYLKGWKAITGGAALPKGLASLAKSFGVITTGGYGLSETCPVLTVSTFTKKVLELDENKKFEQAIKTGVPLPLVNLRVVDSNGKDVPWDNQTIGEIIVRSPWLTKGYYKDEEKTKELWKDGWLHTGDLAVIDEYGYVTIVDREKDAVKSGGEFIPSLLLESMISEIPGVGEVAIIGKSDPKWGERPIAFITIHGKITKEYVLDYLTKFVESGRILKWWIPDDIIILDNMPKTSTGKIDKKELRKKL